MTIGIDTPIPGLIDKIPVRNIWLLLLYASKLYRELSESRRVELEKAPDHIPFLAAEILANAVERRLRRNLSHGYQRRRDDLSRVRGRIDLFRTERRQLLRRGRVACVFDEMTVDTPRNRYVKAALTHIAGEVSKHPYHYSDLERRCRDLANRMERAGVIGHLTSRHAAKVQRLDRVGWVDHHDRQMLAAANLALNLSIPTEQSGLSMLPIVNRSATKGWELYENAVAGFYGVTLSHRGWKVGHGKRMQWPASDLTSGLHAIMPAMITDIVLERRAHSVPTADLRIVIDTKFMDIVRNNQYGRPTLDSRHMYQLYTYLRSQEQPGDKTSLHSTGVLLYPSLGIDYNESASIQGHRIAFATVNLAADSQTIRDQLLRIVDQSVEFKNSLADSE